MVRRSPLVFRPGSCHRWPPAAERIPPWRQLHRRKRRPRGAWWQSCHHPLKKPQEHYDGWRCTTGLRSRAYGACGCTYGACECTYCVCVCVFVSVCGCTSWCAVAQAINNFQQIMRTKTSMFTWYDSEGAIACFSFSFWVLGEWHWLRLFLHLWLVSVRPIHVYTFLLAPHFVMDLPNKGRHMRLIHWSKTIMGRCFAETWCFGPCGSHSCLVILPVCFVFMWHGNASRPTLQILWGLQSTTLPLFITGILTSYRSKKCE